MTELLNLGENMCIPILYVSIMGYSVAVDM